MKKMEKERSVSPLPDRTIIQRVPIYEEKVIETRVPVVDRVDRVVEHLPVHHNF